MEPTWPAIGGSVVAGLADLSQSAPLQKPGPTTYQPRDHEQVSQPFWTLGLPL